MAGLLACIVVPLPAGVPVCGVVRVPDWADAVDADAISATAIPKAAVVRWICVFDSDGYMVSSDGQVTTINDPTPEGMSLLDQPSKIRVHLRRTAGDVQRRNVGLRQHIDDRLGRFSRHAFATCRAGVDVAVRAGMVANFADIDLQDFDAGGVERIDPAVA